MPNISPAVQASNLRVAVVDQHVTRALGAAFEETGPDLRYEEERT
jgi:hypothetical protein